MNDPAQKQYNALPHPFRALCEIDGKPKSIRLVLDQ
jgi:hypothetical protein